MSCDLIFNEKNIVFNISLFKHSTQVELSRSSAEQNILLDFFGFESRRAEPEIFNEQKVVFETTRLIKRVKSSRAEILNE